MQREELSQEKIRENLNSCYQTNEIIILECTESTNVECKKHALFGAKEGLVILAKEQTAGRGRMGRNFFSPSGTGIYMSVLFKPEKEQAENVVFLTSAAAVAVCRGLEKSLGIQTQIKWVNDVYYKERKVCGILTEAVSNGGIIDTVVVGIGINLLPPEHGFPEEIQHRAGVLCEENVISKNKIVAAVLNELYAIYDTLSTREFMEEYRQRSNVLFKKIRFSTADEWKEGEAIAIDEEGGLVVKLSSEETVTLRTGEITVRFGKEDV